MNVETGRDVGGVGNHLDPAGSHHYQCTNMTSTKPETWVKKINTKYRKKCKCNTVDIEQVRVR
jgi:hypothetical protein